jgi:hypothetical protein
MLTDYERQILANVEDYGWHCVGVSDPEGIEPPFAYSVGFTKTLSAPEFIVFGLGQRLMHQMLSRIFEQIEGGRLVGDGSIWDGLIENYPCVARAVHATNIKIDYLNSAMWFWRQSGKEGTLPAYQVIWPGVADRLFPWNAGCHEDTRKAQPPLYLLCRDLQ